MQQEKLKNDLNSLERKINLLVSNYQSSQSEVDSLKKENEDLKTLLDKKDSQLSDFQNRLKISKLVENVEVDKEDVSELNRKIDDYITEIDHCISFLTKE